MQEYVLLLSCCKTVRTGIDDGFSGAGLRREKCEAVSRRARI